MTREYMRFAITNFRAVKGHYYQKRRNSERENTEIILVLTWGGWGCHLTTKGQEGHFLGRWKYSLS